MSGEEGAAGARNVSGKVNETFKVVRNSSTPDRSSIRFIALGSFIIDLASNYLELLRKKKKQKNSFDPKTCSSHTKSPILRDS